MRTLVAICLLFSLAALSGCGGGGGAGPSAVLSGKVTSVDGSNAELAGIVVESLGDGVAVVTEADGSFHIEVEPGDPIVLEFDDPDHPDEVEDGEDDVSEDDDATPDGADIDGDEVELDPLDENERCEIEVEIEDGKVVACRVDHPDREGEDGDDEGPRFRAECRLKPVEGSSEPEAIAEAELVCEDECCVLEVEVGHVLFSETLTVAVECEEVIAELGVIEIVEGGGHFELDSCEVDVLPFEAESVYDLRGCVLLLLDAEGDVALVGCVPGERDEEKRKRFVEDCGLEPVDGSSEPEAEGAAILRCEGDACALVVEVGGVENAEALTLVLECEGDEVELGVLEIVEGAGRFAKEYGPDAPRPFNVESLKQLGGCDLLLVDGDGNVALAGCFPGKKDPADGEGEGDGEGDGNEEGDDV